MITHSKLALMSFGILVVVACAYIVATQEKEIPVVIQTPIVQTEDFSDYDYVALDISPTSTPQSIVPITKTNAFESAPLSMNRSNVVGYIAHGGFVVYVPEWIVQHWTSTSTDVFGSLTFLPKDEVEGVDFSAIDIHIRPTDELFNAEWLYSKDKENSYSAVDTYLNKTEDMRVYYINRKDDERTYLTFYIDGNTKTARITFDATNRNIDTYIPYIKEFVSGLGTGNKAQFDR